MKLQTFKIFVLLLFLFSCRHREEENTPTTGNLRILCDELISPAIEAQKTQFESNYPKSRIDIKLATTNVAIGSLLNNDVECIISTRELDSIETDFLIRNNIKVYSQKLALDGVAIIVNANNPLDKLTLHQLDNILSGRYNYWNEVTDTLSFPSSIQKIEVITDGHKSGNYYLLQNQIMNHTPISPFATQILGDSVNSSSERIMKYILEHEGALGYVSTAWLGKTSFFVKNSKNLKTLRLSETDYQTAVDPIQGYIYRGDYPLRRMLYIMHRQRNIGLAAGFTAFLTGNEGQKIFLNSNLVPAMNPIRLKYE